MAGCPKRFVHGVGMTKFSLDSIPMAVMAHEAIALALKDAKKSMDEIDAIVVSNSDTKMNDDRQRHFPSVLSSVLKRKMPIIRVPAVCGGGGAAFWSGLRLRYKTVLIVGVDKVASSTTPLVTREIMNASENAWEQDEGLIFPAANALVAQQHFTRFGTTHEDLELIAFKNHSNGALNPKAPFYKKPVSMEKIKNGPMIAEPFTLYDCSLTVNGAAAAVISTAPSEVEVIGSGLATDHIAPFEREDMCVWSSTVEAGKEAFAQAKVKQGDISVAEIHDAFSIVELIAYEDLGFCKKGEGKDFVRSGVINLGGRMPTNTSGGLKARGHPISPTGVAQIVEIVDQLRGRCGERQVKGAALGLAHNVGGAGGTSIVHIFRKVAG